MIGRYLYIGVLLYFIYVLGNWWRGDFGLML